MSIKELKKLKKLLLEANTPTKEEEIAKLNQANANKVIAQINELNRTITKRLGEE